MPINKYYGGHGDEVMDNMTKEYGDKKGKSVFYATANKRGLKPMQYGGEVVPDDPFSEQERMKRQLANVPPPPYDIPEPPPMPATPPPEPGLSLSKGPINIPYATPIPQPPPQLETGPDIGVAGATSVPGDPAAAKVQTPVANDHTQTVPAAASDTGDTQEDQATGIPGGAMAPIKRPYSMQADQAGRPQKGNAGSMFNQGNAQQREIDYANQILTDPKTGQLKKPAAWQNVVGGILGAYPRLRGIDVHPNLTRQYKNLAVMGTAAEAERKMEAAQSSEALKREQMADIRDFRERGLEGKDPIYMIERLAPMVGYERAKQIVLSGMDKTKPLTGHAQDVQLLQESFMRTGKHEDGTPLSPEEARDAALDAWKNKTLESSEMYKWIGQTQGTDGKIYDRVMQNRTGKVMILPGEAGARPAIWGSTTEGNRIVETGEGVFNVPTRTTRKPGVPQQGGFGQLPAGGGMPQPPAAPPAAMGQDSVAERNNNPGNLTNPDGSIRQFPDPVTGYNALLADLGDKQAGRAPNSHLTPNSTILDFTKAYAPKNAANDPKRINDPVTYASKVAAKLGVPVTTPISQIPVAALADAVANQEDGPYWRKIQGHVLGGGGAPSQAPAQAAGAPKGPPGSTYIGPPKAAGKSTLMFVPDGKGGMTLTLMKPGDVAPDGSVNPGGMNQINVPTAATRQMAEKAPRVLEFADHINNLLAENERAFGPLAGRMNQLMTGKIGLPGADYVAIRTNMDLLATALMQMHVGQRGGEHMLDHFNKLLGGAEQDPENIRAALSEITRYAGFVSQEGKRGANSGGGAPSKVAVNPQTGERLGLVNGKWVPLKR